MAEPHAHSQPIETYGLAPHNRNIWPYNSQAAVFCLRFWPILLFALVAPLYPLLRCCVHMHSLDLKMSICLEYEILSPYINADNNNQSIITTSNTQVAELIAPVY